MSIEQILKKIDNELKEKETFKKELFEEMRRATKNSKQAIFMIHKGEYNKATRLLQSTKKLFKKLTKVPPTYQNLIYQGIVDAAFQEFTEANVFLGLIQKGTIIGPKKIDVPLTSYLLGLVDVIGELRRRTLDSIRRGDNNTAEESLKMMETIYNNVLLLDQAQHSLSQLRRKCDIARRIIEITRGDVTIELQRSSLENSIKDLEKTLKSKK